MNPVEDCSCCLYVILSPETCHNTLCERIRIAADIVIFIFNRFCISRKSDSDLYCDGTDIACLIYGLVDEVISAFFFVFNERVIDLEHRLCIVIVRNCYAVKKVQRFGITLELQVVSSQNRRRCVVSNDRKRNRDDRAVSIYIGNYYRYAVFAAGSKSRCSFLILYSRNSREIVKVRNTVGCVRHLPVTVDCYGNGIAGRTGVVFDP